TIPALDVSRSERERADHLVPEHRTMPAAGQKRSEIFRVPAESGEILADFKRIAVPRFYRVIDGIVSVAVAERGRDFTACRLLDHGRSTAKGRNLAVADRVPEAHRAKFGRGKTHPQTKRGGVPLIVNLCVV